MKFSQSDFPAFGDSSKADGTYGQGKKMYQKKFQPKADDEESKASSSDVKDSTQASESTQDGIEQQKFDKKTSMPPKMSQQNAQMKGFPQMMGSMMPQMNMAQGGLQNNQMTF